jgi:CheY-like chemotaxis protein
MGGRHESAASTEDIGRGRRVLIVEDDPDARELLTLVLANAGADVRTAADGQIGLRVAEECRPDVVVTDLAMPRMDGLEMVRQLRQRVPTQKTPVIVVTGQAVGDTPTKAQAVGCTELLTKPCDLDHLVEVVNRYAGRRQSDRGETRAAPEPYASHERRRG